jgi:hypothetical protein
VNRNRRLDEVDVDSVPGVSVRNLLADTPDDWFRDPWRYPELRLPGGRDRLGRLPSLASEPVTPPAQIQIPKAPGRTRPASFLMPIDRLRYQVSVDHFARYLKPARHAPAFGWRVHRHSPQPGRYRSQRREWLDCLTVLRGNARAYRHMVFVDIADFFNSIRLDLLRELLDRSRPRGLPQSHLDVLVSSFYSNALPHPGIPQNHLPSAVLANAYVDAALTELECPPGRASVVRWMDDIWIFASTERLVQEATRDVATSLRAFGLALNEQKTRAYEREQVAEAVEGTTVRSPGRAAVRRSGKRGRCEEVNEQWARIAGHADARIIDSLAAQLLYGHECIHPCHDDITVAMIPVVDVAAASPARFQLASRWLAHQQPTLARELLRSTLPRLTDPFNARSCVLAAVYAGEEPRWLLAAARHVPVDRLLMHYLRHAAVRSGRASRRSVRQRVAHPA